MKATQYTHPSRFAEEDRPFEMLIRRTRSRRRWNNNLTIAGIKEIWQHQGGRCALTYIPMILGEGGDLNHQASIDRIDSRGGYTLDNVQIVVCNMNYAKNAGNNQNMRRFIELIVTYNS